MVFSKTKWTVAIASVAAIVLSPLTANATQRASVESENKVLSISDDGLITQHQRFAGDERLQQWLGQDGKSIQSREIPGWDDLKQEEKDLCKDRPFQCIAYAGISQESKNFTKSSRAKRAIKHGGANKRQRHDRTEAVRHQFWSASLIWYMGNDAWDWMMAHEQDEWGSPDNVCDWKNNRRGEQIYRHMPDYIAARPHKAKRYTADRVMDNIYGGHYCVRK